MDLSSGCVKTSMVITICRMSLPELHARTLPELLELGFIEWQKQEGKRKTVADFAVYLGVSQPVLSMWMGGQRKPGPENLKILYAVFGPIVYDVLGMPRPNAWHEYVSRNWSPLPAKVQKQIAETVSKYTTDPLPDEKQAKPSRS